MRLPVVFYTVLATSSVVSAAGTLGFALGFNNADGSCKSQSDYEKDFDALKSVTTLVRTYSSSSCNTAQNILPAAVAKGFKVILGVWPDTDDSYNKDKTALQSALSDSKNAAAIYAITCGSEALYRGDMTAENLLTKINDIKKTFSNIKVGTADSWNKYADGTADPLIKGGVQLFLANGFSFWQAQQINNASHSYLDDMFQAMTHIQNVAGNTDVELWNGETGWPTDGGTNYPPSVAGTDNAQTFYKTGVCAALNWGINVFYFEAFDEPAKPAATGTNGGTVDETHWGLDLQSSSPLQIPIPPLFGSQTTSPSQVDRELELPPLPSLSNVLRFREFEDLDRGLYRVEYNSPSPSQHQRSDSSTYYTAQWGSPYELPKRQQRSRSSTLTVEDSPSLRSRRNKIRGQLPSQFKERSATSISDRAKQDPSHKTPRYSLTQNWLKGNLSYRRELEYRNWLSDDSDTSEIVGKAVSDPGLDQDPNGSWLDLNLRTPEQKNTVSHLGSTKRVDGSLSQSAKSKVHHRALRSDVTLTQQDFDDDVFGARSQILNFSNSRISCSPPSEMLAAMMSGAVPRQSPPTEKPLPPSNKRPSVSSNFSFQRPKKKLVWKGKACVIALPLEDGKDEDGNPKQPLRHDEVADRLDRWKQQGFDIRGFDLSQVSTDNPVERGQSRDIFPDSREWQQDWQTKNFRVSIPNRMAWENYVKQLQEEKLRALGVSFGDEEPARKSPVPSLMSRQASSQASMAASIPGAPLSVNSFRGQLEKPFSPALPGSATQFGPPQPMVSPNMHQGPRSGGFHFSKQSMAFPGEQPFAMGSQFPSQPTPPLSGPWPQPQHLASLPGSRGVSPLIDGRRQSLRMTHSPISPLPDLTTEGYFNPHGGLAHQLRQQQNQSHPAIMQQQQQDQSSLQPQQNLQRIMNENLNRGDLQPKKYLSQPEIASPLPQGHRHNLSATLQKEIDEAEYHLEESIRRQLEEDDEPISKLEPEEAVEEEASPEPVKTAKETKKDPRPDGSDIETNPSIAGSPRPARLNIDSNTNGNDLPGHTPKSSASKLNVNAQEFVFDPTKSSFTPMFSFGSKSTTSVGPPSVSSVPGPQGFHSKNTSNASTFSSSLNVAAPAFTPGKFQGPNISNREFSFSSSIPVLKPDAPSFTPSAGLGAKIESEPGKLDKVPPKIFGNIDYSDVIKPAKKSKAIPIVKPKEESNEERFSDGQEDESGRITQADGRQKRLRRGDHSGNQVPLFATPTLEKPTEPVTRHSSVDGKSPSIVTSLDEDTTPIEKANDQLKEIVDELQVSDSPSSVEEAMIPIATPGRFRLTDDESGPVANESRSISISSKATEEATEKGEVVVDAVLQSSNDVNMNGTPSSLNKSSLSATAKPFDFKPTDSVFQPAPDSREPIHERVPPSLSGSIKPSVKVGLGASRYAPQDPSTEPSVQTSPVSSINSPKAATSVQSLDARVINGVQYVEPTTYQEIDDVMKHLNGDDSDLGVERNPAESWRSPARSVRSVRARSPVLGLDGREYVSDVEDASHLHAQRQVITASPNRLHQPFQYLPQQEFGSSDSAEAELVAKNARFSPSYKPPKHPYTDVKSPVYNLNNVAHGVISDWDDVVSSSEEAKFHQRSRFFSNRVDDLVGSVMEDRLRPLERTLADVSTSLAKMTGRSRSRRYRRSTSAEVENSDADDEDDEATEVRALSPLRDRKYDKLKTLLIESMNSQNSNAPGHELAKLTESLAGLRTFLTEQRQDPSKAERSEISNELTTISHTIMELRESLQKPQQPVVEPVPSDTSSLVNLTKAIAELKASLQEQQKHPSTASDVKAIIEDAISKQMRGKSAPVTSTLESATSEKLRLQVTGLESMLKIAESRADEEFRARRAAEDDLADTRRMLKAAQADASEQRESAEETELSLRSFLDDQQQSKQHMAMLEEVKTALEKTISDLSDKNSALEETLEEYRKSHTDWRVEMDSLTQDTDTLTKDNENLARTIQALKSELEDGIETKHAFKNKFERLQEDMAETARSIARDQASWRNKDEEHKAKHEHQGARLEAEARTRERLELEIDRLEKQEKEAMKSRFLIEQVRVENSHLASTVNELRAKSHQHQDKSMNLERELHDTKENSRLEIQRILTATKADVGAASQQVNILRANLEGVIGRLESQLEYAKTDANNAKQRYELMLEEASASRDVALREAAEAREAALQEHYRFHERTLEETKASHARTLKEMESLHDRTLTNAMEDHQRAMSNVVEDHERSLNTAMEDKRMTENYLNGRLNLADEKVIHYQDRVASLEERLEIAKSAAQAAADAARSVRGSAVATSTSHGSMPVALGSNLPDKISPQALRESILVLQEQLHEREGQIEKLQQELGEIDRDARNKVKDRDVEISWLRELLGVRLDDLQDIITTLESPSYDRDAVRDAAIRLKANLQMEQQEKERAMAGGQRFPSLANLSNITASPRSLPMAAAAAWGNWRKGQSSLNSLAEMAAPNRSASQTPSKSSPQSFLSGLLTPPNTNIRHTPQPRSSYSARQQRIAQRTAQRHAGGDSNPKLRLSPSRDTKRRQASAESTDLPQTPTLLRTASYDQDAETGHYSLERYVADQDDENVSPADGHVQAEIEAGEAIFGPSIELAG